MVFCVFGDADYGKGFAFFLWIINLELPPDRIFVMEEVLHHGFVDYCDASGSRCILRADVAAKENGNSEGSEITGSNGVLAGAPLVSVCRSKAGNNDWI